MRAIYSICSSYCANLWKQHDTSHIKTNRLSSDWNLHDLTWFTPRMFTLVLGAYSLRTNFEHLSVATKIFNVNWQLPVEVSTLKSGL